VSPGRIGAELSHDREVLATAMRAVQPSRGSPERLTSRRIFSSRSKAADATSSSVTTGFGWAPEGPTRPIVRLQDLARRHGVHLNAHARVERPESSGDLRGRRE